MKKLSKRFNAAKKQCRSNGRVMRLWMQLRNGGMSVWVGRSIEW